LPVRSSCHRDRPRRGVVAGGDQPEPLHQLELLSELGLAELLAVPAPVVRGAAPRSPFCAKRNDIVLSGDVRRPLE
jgi:hypothetical protein